MTRELIVKERDASEVEIGGRRDALRFPCRAAVSGVEEGAFGAVDHATVGRLTV